MSRFPLPLLALALATLIAGGFAVRHAVQGSGGHRLATAARELGESRDRAGENEGRELLEPADALLARLAVGSNGSAITLLARVNRELRLRRTPQLTFAYDPSIERGVRMSHLIDELAPTGDDDDGA